MNVKYLGCEGSIHALVRSGETIDGRRLADPDIPLPELLPADVSES